MEFPALLETDWELVVHRFPISAEIPPSCFKSKFYSITRTEDELSIVCESSLDGVNSIRSEKGWRRLKVSGLLDFSLTGTMSAISGPLAANGIPIFAISTFDTDYILIKAERWKEGKQALTAAGFRFG